MKQSLQAFAVVFRPYIKNLDTLYDWELLQESIKVWALYLLWIDELEFKRLIFFAEEFVKDLVWSFTFSAAVNSGDSEWHN